MSSIDDVMSRIQQIMSRMQEIENLARRPPAAGSSRTAPISPEGAQAAPGAQSDPAGGAAFQQLLEQALAAGTSSGGGAGGSGDLSLLPSNLGSLSSLGSALGLNDTTPAAAAGQSPGSADSALRLQEYQKLLIKAIQELAAEQKRGPETPSAPQPPQVK